MEMLKHRGEIWAMSGVEREAKGRCLCDMVMDTSLTESTQGGVTRFRYTFKRAKHGASLLDSHLTFGDPVVVSTESGKIGIAVGFVLNITDDYLVLGVDREIDHKHNVSTMRFRIDKDELVSGMATLRGNLVRLFAEEEKSRLRALIVDLAKPTFTNYTSYTTSELDVDQCEAISKVLAGMYVMFIVTTHLMLIFS
jgi:DNA replication ATP-dependent helicase Dna2